MPTQKELLNNAKSMALVVGIVGIFFVMAGILGKYEGTVIDSSYSISRTEDLWTRIMQFSFGGIFLLFSFFVGFCAVFFKITPIKFRSLLNDIDR